MNLPTKTIIYFVAPKIMEILGDIVRQSVTSENLLQLRKRLYALTCNITGQTVFSIGEELAGIFLETITSPKAYLLFGDALLDIVEEWVEASESKWDDALILPALQHFREVAGIPDEVGDE